MADRGNAAYVYSGLSGSQLAEFFDYFSWPGTLITGIASIGDLNQDGHSDFLVGFDEYGANKNVTSILAKRMAFSLRFTAQTSALAAQQPPWAT